MGFLAYILNMHSYNNAYINRAGLACLVIPFQSLVWVSLEILLYGTVTVTIISLHRLRQTRDQPARAAVSLALCTPLILLLSRLYQHLVLTSRGVRFGDY